VIHAKDISFYFEEGKSVLQNISFDLEKGKPLLPDTNPKTEINEK
jgi:ABC-type multidrug transport system fused ATPase/permease subunit